VRGAGSGQNGCQDCLGIAQHVTVPETEDTVPGLSQVTRPLCVGRAIKHMLRAIKLYDEPALSACEVHDVAANRPLTPELEAAKLARPQMTPN